MFSSADCGPAAKVMAADDGPRIAVDPRQFDGAAKLLDSLIHQRKHLAGEAPLHRVVTDQLAQSRPPLLTVF